MRSVPEASDTLHPGASYRPCPPFARARDPWRGYTNKVRFLVGGLIAALVLAGGCGARDPGPSVLTPIRDPGAAGDPINMTSQPLLFRHSQRVLAELIAALPDDQRARVANLTLTSDNRLGDVNAFATCSEDGSPMIGISDGIITIAAHLAMGTATDELFETDKAREYLVWLSQHGLDPPPVAFYSPAYHTDPRKVARQKEVFEEQIAFVLGHELAHHYLGHLACNSASGGLDELGQIAADNVPAFNQIAELAADTAATKNLLAAGVARTGYTWTEHGALLVLAAFNRNDAIGVSDVLLAFERTHPLPVVRVPVITLAAELWYSSGGILPL
jgi:hypothetical protein